MVLYETARARRQANIRLSELGCDECQWASHSFTALKEEKSADDAAAQVSDADVVIFAISPTGDLHREIKMWCERWVHRRREREGTIVGLVHPRSEGHQAACLKEIYLRHLAHRARMDYLSDIPAMAPCQVIPDSLDSYRRRAAAVTSVLDGILHTHNPPPSAGL